MTHVVNIRDQCHERCYARNSCLHEDTHAHPYNFYLTKGTFLFISNIILYTTRETISKF